MRIAYLDCFAGISGDMFLGALLDAGVPQRVLEDAVGALGLGAGLTVEKVDRSGISAVKVTVLEGGELVEGSGGVLPEAEPGPASRVGETQHSHKREHRHTHAEEFDRVGQVASDQAAARKEDGDGQRHSHVHGRSLTVIRALIQASKLEPGVKAFAIKTFEMLGASEAKIHNVPVGKIHFHEVGAVDAIVDIVGVAAGVAYLGGLEGGAPAWHCSALNVGGGMVECAHGRFPVPAPATADLLRGMPTYSGGVQQEMVTPTGAALVRSLAPSFGGQPGMRVEAIGYGAGSRNPAGFPNVLRLSLGEAEERAGAGSVAEGWTEEEVTVLETALDDLSPQIVAHVAERALALGALDVMLTAVTMKKGRPGTLMTVLCDAGRRVALEDLLLRETSTLGVRVRKDRRVCLARAHVSVETQYGAIRMKVGSRAGEAMNAAPEYEDCRAAAEREGVAVKQVMQAAGAAYFLGTLIEGEKA